MLNRVLVLFFVFIGFYNISIASVTDSLLKVVKQTKVDTTLINCWNELSNTLSSEDTVQSKAYASKALQLAQRVKYSKGIIKAYYNLAYLAEFSYQYPLAEKYYLSGIQQSKKVNDLSLEAFGMCDYALTLKKQAKHKEALAINLEALAIYQTLKDTPHIASLFTNLGNNYKNLSQFNNAVDAHLKALQIEQLRKNDKGIAKAYNNIGLVYERNGDYESALKNYLLMVLPAQKSGSKKIIATAYCNIGSTYQNLKEHQKAIPFMDTAFAFYKELNDLPNIGLVLSNLAAAYNDLKKYSTSIKYSIQCIQVSKEAADLESEAYAYLNLGKSYTNLENFNAAKPNLLRAEELIDSIGSSAFTMLAYEELSNYYEKAGDFKNAFQYHQLLSVIKDTIYNAEKHLQISSLQTQYQTVEKEKALVESKAENLQKNLQIQKKNNLLLISILALVGLLAVSILIWRNAALRGAKLIQEKELSEAKAKHQLQEEKLRISRELHDNIGAQLTFINSSLQNLSATNDEEMEQTKAMTLNAIRELRSIVWLINKEEFHVDELVIKLRDLMKPLQNRKPKIEIVSIENEELKLNANIASNVFRIIQEATNNTLKYAEANELTITIDASNGADLKIKIHDDGIGFNPNEVTYSFGLKNIKARVNSLNGQFELKSNIGLGTELNLMIPIV